MISVSISINGEPIFTRSATRFCDMADGKTCTYNVDDGSQVLHKPKDGAIKLAIKLLKTIKEKDL